MLTRTEQDNQALPGFIASRVSHLDEQVEQLFKAHSKYLTEPRMLEAAKENIRGNVMWMVRNAKAVCQWLDKQA